MHAVFRFSSPYSEPWVAWTMFTLLVLMLFADLVRHGVIAESFRSITAAKERDSIFSDISNSILGNILMFIYQIGIVSMALYMILASDDFSFSIYCLIALCLCVLSVIRYLAQKLVVYVFLDKNMLAPILMHSDNLNIVFCTLLYPIVLLGLFCPLIGHTMLIITFSVIAISALFIWIIKAFRLFFTNYLAVFYIFLYLCTLEIIPFAALIIIVRYWIV